MTPAYWREYRRRNRERLAEQLRARRSTPESKARRAAYRRRPEVRAREAARPSRAAPALEQPLPHTGHPLFDAARLIVPRDPNAGLLMLRDPLVEDLRSEAVVALLEGRDPRRAVAAYRRAEAAWGRLTLPLAAWAS